MRRVLFRAAVAALFALASAAGAIAQEALGDIMWRFRDKPEEGVHRLVFAVEELGVDVNGAVRTATPASRRCVRLGGRSSPGSLFDWARSRVAPETEAGRCLSAPRSTAYRKIRS